MFSIKFKTLVGNQLGHTILTAAFAVTGGLAFTFMFNDLTRYVAATNAVEQAARKAARCLTPTDADCLSVNAAAPTGAYDWYGSQQDTMQVSTAKRYHYSAAVYSQTWSASYTTYETHLVPEPPVNWTTYSVPQKTFQPRENEYQYRYAAMQMQVKKSEFDYYAPYSTPNFMTFDETTERSYDKGSSWAPYDSSLATISTGSRPNKIYDTSSSFSTRQGQTHTLTTGWISVPSLRSSGSFKTASGGNYNPSNEAHGGYQNGEDPLQTAYVAIKADGSFALTSGSQTSIKWGTSSQDGLEIETCDPANNCSPTNVRRTSTRGLGGRDYSGTGYFTSSAKDFNLWLRGPSGAHGGNVNNTHDAIAVPRGGWFRLIVRINQHASYTARVSSSIRLRAWINDYQEVWHDVFSSAVCPEQQLTPTQATPTCPSRSQCGFTSDWTDTVSCTEDTSKRRTAPRCGSDSKTFSVSAALGTQKVTAAVCDSSWKPSTTLPTAASGRLYCRWDETSSKSVVVGTTPSNCPLRTTTPHSEQCNSGGTSDVPYQASGSYGNLSQCSSVTQALSTVSSSVSQVNSAQASGAPSFGALQSGSFAWAAPVEYQPQRWAFSWDQPLDKNGQPLSGAQTVRSTANSVNNASPIYKHTDGSWQPAPTDFSIVGLDGSAPSTAYLNSKVAIALASESTYNFSSAYPFANSTEFEIPARLPLITDNGTESCDTSDTPSMDERLRVYAAKEVPAVADTSVVLNSSAEFQHTMVVEQSSACGAVAALSVSLPHCSPVTSEAIVTTCAPQLAASASPEAPTSCKDGTYDVCFSSVASLSEAAPDIGASANVSLAQARGFEEIKRTFPDAQENCAAAGCASFTIDAAADGGTSASVDVKYELPISFPLSSILGKSSVTVEHNKKEVMELAVNGR